MTEYASIALGAIAGALLGGVFFGGLCWTVRRALTSRAAGAWFACSYLLRFAIVAAGLYALAHDDAARGTAAALGLIAARLAVVWLGGRSAGAAAVEKAG